MAITKAQAERAAELATPEELKKFYDNNRMQFMCEVLQEWSAYDRLVADARKMVREILKRDRKPSARKGQIR